MPWRPPPSDRFYSLLVRLGLLLRWVFQVRIISSGTEHLPAPEPHPGSSRQVVPGHGAVFAITHFGYVDFAVAEIIVWKHSRARLRFLIHQGAAGHWLAGPAISAANSVVVGHGDGGAAYGAAVEKLRAGEYLAVFPEAGISRSFMVRECRTGAVRMAADAGVPLVPVSVWGAHRLLTRGHGFSIRQGWRAPVRIHVGQPLRFQPGVDVERETRRLRRILQAGVDRCLTDFPLVPEPGAWWMPARQGGGAPSEAERQALDAEDEARRRRRGPRQGRE